MILGRAYANDYIVLYSLIIGIHELISQNYPVDISNTYLNITLILTRKLCNNTILFISQADLFYLNIRANT